MNEYTDSASRPGRRLNTGTDDRELFMVEFGDLVLQAYEETLTYGGLSYVKTITSGKADTFPIIGRKRDAQEHVPGDRILGGTMEHNDIEISVDRMIVDSVFIPEIDQLMNHYSVMEPYSRQLGESLSTVYDRRTAIMHILASRQTVRPYGRDKASYDDGGGPLPNGYFDGNLRTDASKLELASYAGLEWILRHDIGGGGRFFMLPHAQVLLLARYTGIDKVITSGSGDRANANVGAVAGLVPKGSNHIPKTNITSGLAKYQGDFRDVVGHISNRMAVGTLNLRGMRVVMKEQADRLGTLLIASMVNGMGTLRDECSFEVATTDITGVRGANHPDA